MIGLLLARCTRDVFVWLRKVTSTLTLGRFFPFVRKFRHRNTRILNTLGHTPFPRFFSTAALHSPVANEDVKPLMLNTPLLMAKLMTTPSKLMKWKSTTPQYTVFLADSEAAKDTCSFDGDNIISDPFLCLLGAPKTGCPFLSIMSNVAILSRSRFPLDVVAMSLKSSKFKRHRPIGVLVNSPTSTISTINGAEGARAICLCEMLNLGKVGSDDALITTLLWMCFPACLTVRNVDGSFLRP
mmetsp:Transcript_21493/g.41726  ORF Transcript_21493/g.41726 Transcript_21493/m.41726 type:complete len:241 (-) Transcript_21493:568-1290(-)